MRNLSEKYGKKRLFTATKTGLGSLKSASKYMVHIAAEGAGEFIENKIAKKIVKSKPLRDEN